MRKPDGSGQFLVLYACTRAGNQIVINQSSEEKWRGLVNKCQRSIQKKLYFLLFSFIELKVPVLGSNQFPFKCSHSEEVCTIINNEI